MKFVALISGGKDLFYNLHHCLTQGHELAALANLYPVERDEIDLFMFQTVGHDVIDFYQNCLDVPLYRQPIKGGSKNQNLEYEKTADDEIEDLYCLLQRVLEAQPDVKGVSCGAILSQYQRTRVEHVCKQLGLTPLAYLWQRDQQELMAEMCELGLDARLIKVAAIGLNTGHLGKTIQQMYPVLLGLNQRFDVHICGEGGEFETLVFDACYFKKRLEVVEQEIILLDNDVAYLKVKVEVKDKAESLLTLAVAPPLLEEPFTDFDTTTTDLEVKVIDKLEDLIELSPLVKVDGNRVYVGNLTSLAPLVLSQLTNIFNDLTLILNNHQLTLDDIQCVTLLLRDMAAFEEVNAIYVNYFIKPLPPLRICIATQRQLAEVSFSCTIIKHRQGPKQGVHIFSRLFWAPLNIGPYSQSIVDVQPTYRYALLSGQIPLIPALMDLETNGCESALSLQHLHRVLAIVNTTNYDLVICFITDPALMTTARHHWQQYTEHIGDASDQLIIVLVDQLPRGALIEWGGTSYTEISLGIDYGDSDDEDDTPKASPPGFDHGRLVAFGDRTTFTGFTNDASVLNSGLVVATAPIANSAWEVLPVSCIWDVNGREWRYATVVRTQH